MKRGKNRNKTRLYFLGLLALLVAFCIPVAAGSVEAENEYEIYPTPQEISYENGTTALSQSVKVTYGEDIDSYTQQRVEDTLEVLGLQSATSGTGNTELIVGVYGSNDAADQQADSLGAGAELFEDEKKFDAYALQISNGKIVILGEDTDAAFYGVTTLKRIFEQVDMTQKSVRNLTIKDYAEVEFRGFIEGYYGNPWSHEDRVDLMEFGGNIKMNQYVFAPKDDPYHNARWRELYPAEDLAKIKELAKAGNENKCFYVYALHPFMNKAINLSDSTYESEVAVIKNKFEQVIRDADVRQIAILEDDAGGETAARMVRFLTDMNNWLHELKATYPDLKTDLLYCPTDYMSTTSAKLTTISNGVSDEIHIVVTGGKIWGEVSENFATNFYNGSGRYPYMWVNWPCNDNTKTSQIMGGHNYILHTGIDGSHYEGIILNPIQESEPSKVGIFTASDYCWNVWQTAEEGDQAWEDSFKYIDHMTAIETESSTALREVARHMITQSPDQTVAGKQVQFDESLNIKEEITDFIEKMEAGTYTSNETESLKEEFQTIRDAAEFYMESGTNTRMASQMTPFLSCLRDMVQADIYLLDALDAILSGDGGAAYDNFSNAQMNYEKSKTYGFEYYGAGTIYAQAARKYITPFTDTAMKYVSDEVKQIIDPENIKFEKTLIFQIGGSTTAGSVEGIPSYAMDGNQATVYYLKTDQVIGDYVGLSFTIPITVKNIQLSLALSGHENDYIADGRMEYTVDGKTWVAFADTLQPDSGPEVKMEFPEPVEIKGFRWKCIGLGGRDRWLAVKEIGYNVSQEVDTGEERYTATFSRPSYWEASSGEDSFMTDGDESACVHYNPTNPSAGDEFKDYSMEGDFIQLDLGAAKPVGRVRALVGNGDDDKWTKYHIEYSATGNDDDWTSLPSYTSTETMDIYEENLGGISVRYIKLVNDEAVHKWVKFCEFAAYSYVESGTEPEGDVMDYTNTKNAEWRVEYGEESSKVFPKEGAVLQPGEYIGLKLSRIRAVTGITVTGTGTEKLTLETSVNRVEWTGGNTDGNARYIRLMNKSSQPVSFDLDSFVVTSDEIMPISFLESNIGGSSNANDPRYLGTTQYWMDGNLATSAKYCGSPEKGSYITYDLGQEVDLRSLRVYVSNSSVDYPRDAKIQASLTNSGDESDWTDILTIGDGVSNTANDKDNTPTDSETDGWTQGSGEMEVVYAYVENANIANVKARYIRLYFTAAYSSRWVELNEIRINDDEYIPSIIDPTFETNVSLQRGCEPQNLNDGNLTTFFKPADESLSGYLIYNLSDTVEIGQINILQSGNSISNAVVSVRTGEDVWQDLGKLDKNLSTFDTTDLDAVYAIKLEWSGIQPVIYEISTLLGPKLDAANSKLDAANREVGTAESDLNSIKAQVALAEQKVASAVTEADKLQAEVELQNKYAEQSGAEALLAEKRAAAAEMEMIVARLEAEKIRIQAKNLESTEQKLELEADALQKDVESDAKQAESEVQNAIVASKKNEQDSYVQAAAGKQAALDALKAQGNNTGNSNTGNGNTGNNDTPDSGLAYKDFTVKTIKYEVIDASKKTVAAAGPANKKTVKSVSIPNTVKYDNATWTVVQVKASAFKGCKKLTKVTIGSKVVSIGKNAFAQCTKLKTINMKKAAKLTSIGKKAFSKINAKAKITVPAKKLAKFKKWLKTAGVPKTVSIKK